MHQAIRLALYRLRLQTTPKGIVHALAQQGIQVAEELVRTVLMEMLKETRKGRVARVSRPGPVPGP
jgi:hypothetical protein